MAESRAITATTTIDSPSWLEMTAAAVELSLSPTRAPASINGNDRAASPTATAASTAASGSDRSGVLAISLRRSRTPLVPAADHSTTRLEPQRRDDVDQRVVAFRAARARPEVVEHRGTGDKRQLTVGQQRELLVAYVRAHSLTRLTTAARAAESRDRTVPTGTPCARAISS